ncbi:MAG: FeoB small GTPase domain-containing protein, partial [Desulfobacterales bacterium]
MREANRAERYSTLITPDILLVGHPNVGKSVLFSRMTGVRTLAANYPGTTVGYTKGRTRFEGQDYTVVDAPGSYSLEPLDAAAKVAVDLIDQAKRIINVVDATHLERQLPLTIELLNQGKPTVVALNMSDEARHRGIEIDVKKLGEKLDVAVISTVARSGLGVRRLIQAVLTLTVESPAPCRDQSGPPDQHPHIAHDSNEEVKYDHRHLADKDV